MADAFDGETIANLSSVNQTALGWAGCKPGFDGGSESEGYFWGVVIAIFSRVRPAMRPEPPARSAAPPHRR